MIDVPKRVIAVFYLRVLPVWFGMLIGASCGAYLNAQPPAEGAMGHLPTRISECPGFILSRGEAVDMGGLERHGYFAVGQATTVSLHRDNPSVHHVKRLVGKPVELVLRPACGLRAVSDTD